MVEEWLSTISNFFKNTSSETLLLDSSNNALISLDCDSICSFKDVYCCWSDWICSLSEINADSVDLSCESSSSVFANSEAISLLSALLFSTMLSSLDNIDSWSVSAFSSFNNAPRRSYVAFVMIDCKVSSVMPIALLAAVVTFCNKSFKCELLLVLL
ncbi:hypothetical protein WICPIJ_009090 [Wickerhamomyces pijperi]|uniref:Uncharacterized protein n=1 Tax=Wickerhamomyces pijperi TaxID=599730 RepID=A0A9P8TF14_WICPI|nr:hypothetical protein WICPIJ_009090 [Wickerhamomyces pijperi]